MGSTLPVGGRGRNFRCSFRERSSSVGPWRTGLRSRILTSVAARTGISKSTLSRLESGQRKPSLELLLPLADAYQLPLDELVGAPEVGDPRVRFKPRTRNGRLVFPLTQQSSGLAVWKVVIPPERERNLRTHDGYEWLHVLSGQMRLILGEHDITMGPGDVAEFDTRMPHWFGPAGDGPVEILSVHSSHGKRMHVRAAPRHEHAPH
jgi:transcriptional regulator with XRE-family HTH domain